MAPRLDLSGQKFGRLTVAARGEGRRWSCLCACGASVSVLSYNLKSGDTQSCGCLQRELVAARSTIHGKAPRGARAGAYSSWAGMLTRVTNPDYPGYKIYGGRGITVCERWFRFENFFEDMGERPEGLSLERRDVNGPYSPDNCCWATREVQNNNRRKSVKYLVDGQMVSVAQAARYWGTTWWHASRRLGRN